MHQWFDRSQFPSPRIELSEKPHHMLFCLLPLALTHAHTAKSQSTYNTSERLINLQQNISLPIV